MSTIRGRVALIAILLAGLAVAGCGGDDEPATPTATAPTTTADASTSTTTTVAEPAGRVIEVRLVGGDVEGGPRLETVSVGDTVTIRAVSDVAEELHVHTYDLKVDLEAGTPGEVTFDASIPGRHEVEFERSGQVALTLEVR